MLIGVDQVDGTIGRAGEATVCRMDSRLRHTGCAAAVQGDITVPIACSMSAISL
jgi:hypothetical protein